MIRPFTTLSSETLAATLKQQQLYFSLQRKAKKLLAAGIKGHVRHKRLLEILYPYQKRKDLSFVHKSILNEQLNYVDLSKKILNEIGEPEPIDAFWPMLIQQAFTLEMIVEIFDQGLLEAPSGFGQVMEKIVEPLVMSVDGSPPFNWLRGVNQLPISYAQPFANTVLLGTKEHIIHDFNVAFSAMAEQPNMVVPIDWINSWAIVLGVTEQTVPAFRQMSGHNSWSTSGIFLDTALGNYTIRPYRDIPYIGYAKKKGMDITKYTRGYPSLTPSILMTDPAAEIKKHILEMIRKKNLAMKLKQSIQEFKL